MLNQSQKNKITDLCISILAFMLIVDLVFKIPQVTMLLSKFTSKTGFLGLIIISVLQFVQVVFVPMPASFITLTSMKMYSNHLILLFLVTLSSILLGTIVTYLIGYKWGRKALTWCAGSDDEYDKWQKYLTSKKTNVTYFMTVLLPVFPDDVLCLMAGSVKMNFWWYLFSNVIGRAVGLFTFMFVFKSISDSLATSIVLLILLSVLIVYKLILKRRMK